MNCFLFAIILLRQSSAQLPGAPQRSSDNSTPSTALLSQNAWGWARSLAGRGPLPTGLAEQPGTCTDIFWRVAELACEPTQSSLRSQIAYNMTSCALAEAGRPPLSAPLSQLDTHTFQLYSQVWLHVDSMCFQSYQSVWALRFSAGLEARAAVAAQQQAGCLSALAAMHHKLDTQAASAAPPPHYYLHHPAEHTQLRASFYEWCLWACLIVATSLRITMYFPSGRATALFLLSFAFFCTEMLLVWRREGTQQQHPPDALASWTVLFPSPLPQGLPFSHFLQPFSPFLFALLPLIGTLPVRSLAYEINNLRCSACGTAV